MLKMFAGQFLQHDFWQQPQAGRLQVLHVTGVTQNAGYRSRADTTIR